MFLRFRIFAICKHLCGIYAVRAIGSDESFWKGHPIIFASVTDFPPFSSLRSACEQPPPLQQPELRLSPGLAGPVAPAEAHRGPVHAVRLPFRAQGTQRGRGAEARVCLLR